MPATITGTGTWTDLTGVFDTTRSNATGNEMRLEGVKGVAPGGLGANFEVLKTMEGVDFPELVQFIDVVAAQYGLLHWPAADFLYQMLKAHVQTKSDTVLGDSTGRRTFTP